MSQEDEEFLKVMQSGWINSMKWIQERQARETPYDESLLYAEIANRYSSRSKINITENPSEEVEKYLDDIINLEETVYDYADQIAWSYPAVINIARAAYLKGKEYSTPNTNPE